MNTNRDILDEVAGDGGDLTAMPAEDLALLVAEIGSASTKCATYARERLEAEYTRFALWDGQAPDGRLHREYLGREPYPFEGASDQRVGLVDEIISEHVVLGLSALMRANVRCVPVGGQADAARASKMTVLLKWLLGRMGMEWWAQHAILLNWLHQDSPAVAMMRLGWETQSVTEMKRLSVDELGAIWETEFGQRAQMMGVQVDDQQMAVAREAFQTLLQAPAEDGTTDDTELADMVQRYFPRISARRARKVVRELRQKGTAEFPVQSEKFGRPTCVARRFGEGFLIPDNCRQFDKARVWFEPEWISAAELRARIENDGWKPAFVEAVLKHEGVAQIPEIAPAADGVLTSIGEGRHTGEYQVVWCWYLATNDDGVMGRYYSVVHKDAGVDAFGRRLYRARGTKWPAVLHRREYLDAYCLNSRGVPEIVGADQAMLKLMRDSTADNAQVGAVPPVFASGFRSKERQRLRQNGWVSGDRVGSTLSYLQPPAFPAACFRVLDEIQAAANRRWGRPSKDADPTMLQLYRTVFVQGFLGAVREELQVLLDLALTNMSDADLAAIMNAQGNPVARSMKEIEGEYEAQLSWDPADLDWERLSAMAQSVLPALVQLDQTKSMDVTPVVKYLVRSMMPQLADEAIRPENAGLDAERRDEEHNLLLLRAGLIPAMDTEGRWNYAARSQLYEEMEAQSQPTVAPWNPQLQIPEVWADMGADKYGNLLRWRAALEEQAKQFGENAQIGRTMVKDTTGVPSVGGDADSGMGMTRMPMQGGMNSSSIEGM
jgi:hypothetical protein